jgi:hypothetical protein
VKKRDEALVIRLTLGNNREKEQKQESCAKRKHVFSFGEEK